MLGVLGGQARHRPVDGADHKSRLQELSAHLFSAPPRYEVEATGPDHARTFFVTATIGGGLRPRRGPIQEAGRAGRRSPRWTRWSTTTRYPEGDPPWLSCPSLRRLRRELEKESVGKRFKAPEITGTKVAKRNGAKKVLQARPEGPR